MYLSYSFSPPNSCQIFLPHTHTPNFMFFLSLKNKKEHMQKQSMESTLCWSATPKHEACVTWSVHFIEENCFSPTPY